MSNLDNLVSKIIADGEAQAAAIINSAQEKAKEIVAQKLKEAEAEDAAIRTGTDIAAENLKSQMISDAHRQARDDIVTAKREVMDRVCAEAVRRLNDLPADEFAAFVARSLAAETLTGDEEIIVPEKYRGTAVAGVKTSGEERPISGGFILKSGRIEKNNVFASLVHFHRDEIEDLIMQNLF